MIKEQLDLIIKMETNILNRMNRLIKKIESGEMTEAEQIGANMIKTSYALNAENQRLVVLLRDSVVIEDIAIVESKGLAERIDRIVSLVETNAKTISVSEKIKKGHGGVRKGISTDDLIAAYQEHKNLEKVGKLFGMSGAGVKNRLEEEGAYKGKKNDYGTRKINIKKGELK